MPERSRHPAEAPATGGADRPGSAAAAIAGAWGVLGFAAVLAVAGLEPNLVEEGLLLHVGQRLAAGEHLYRDIVFFTSPLPFELLGVLFRVFGDEVRVARAAAAVFHAVATAATFGLARRAGAGPAAHAAAAVMVATPLLLFPMFSMYYYTPLAVCVGAASVYAALRGLDSALWAFAAGVGVAAVALCKQTLGAAFAAALLPAMAACAAPGRRLHRVLATALGGAAVTVLTLAFYGLRGDLPDLWRCLVAVPLSLTEAYRAPFINLWPPGELADEIIPNRPLYFSNLFFLRYGLYTPPGFAAILSTQLLYALPLAALGGTALLRLRGPLAPGLWLNGAFLFAMAMNLFPRSDWGHLAPALPPAIVQAVLLLALARPGGTGSRIPAVAASAVCVVALAASGVQVARWVHAEAGKPTWGPRVPLQPVSAVYRVPSVPRVIHFLRQRLQPGEPIFVARAEPLLYFATDAVNPTPFTGVLTTLHAEQEAAILAALPGVRFVVMSDTDQPLWTYYSDELPAVWKHLERHYRVAPFFPLDDASWLIVLERGEDRGPTLVDLVDERARARAWLRHEKDGERVPATEPTPRLVARHNHRPVAVRVSRWGGGLDYDLRVPEAGARFQAGIGYRGMVSDDGFWGHPSHSDMVVSVGRDGAFEEVLRVRVDDSKKAGRTWTPIEGDLSSWAGQRITLRLSLEPERAIRKDAELTWWGSPRIAGPPAGRTGAGETQETQRAADGGPNARGAG